MIDSDLKLTISYSLQKSDKMENEDKKGFINSGHASQALQRMDHFLRNKQLCDVVLIAGNRRIPAHRLVLCSLR